MKKTIEDEIKIIRKNILRLKVKCEKYTEQVETAQEELNKAMHLQDSAKSSDRLRFYELCLNVKSANLSLQNAKALILMHEEEIRRLNESQKELKIKELGE